MQAQQSELLLEDIARRTHSQYHADENIPQVFIIGSIGAGKSSFLHAVHKSLQYHNAWIRIKQKRATSSNQLLIQRVKYNIRRANATVEPEEMTLYTCLEGKIIPLQMTAEGSHENAKHLSQRKPDDDVKEPDVVVFCLDLSFADYLFKNRWWARERIAKGTYGGYRWKLEEEITFKKDLNTSVYISFVESVKACHYWKKDGAVIIPLFTHYRSVGKEGLSELMEGSLLDRIDDKIDQDISTGQVHAMPYVYDEKNHHDRMTRLSALFSCEPIPIDSRVKSLYGVEEAAYRIAIAATGKADLRLVSFSNQRKDNEKLVKYSTLAGTR